MRTITRAVLDMLANVAIVLLFVFAARVDAADSQGETMDQVYLAAHLRTEHCVQFQLFTNEAGWAIGKHIIMTVDGRTLPATIKAFRCLNGYSGQDAALVERDDSANPWTYVLPLDELRAINGGRP
jgi:hypothetical protein